MRLILSITFAIACGTLVCAYRRGWIIIAYPSHAHTISIKSKQKKEIVVYWHHHDCWRHEKVTMLWSDDMAINMYHLVNRWLEILDDEQITQTRVALHSAIITPSGSTAYLSFDSSPLPQQISAYAKLCIVEGLLKTIRQNGITVQDIHLLVHHQPLVDTHLEFAHAWPITGFIA